MRARPPAWERLLPLVAVALALGSWAGVKHAFGIADYVLPGPQRVLDAFRASPRPFLIGCYETALSAVLGFGIAAAVGVLAASAMSLLRVVERAVYPLTLLFQMVPLIAIAPLLVVWCGYGRPATVAATAVVAVFPVIANTLAGLRERDPQLDELFAVLRAGRFAAWWKLALPSAVPSIVTGLRIAAGLATIGTISGEFVAGIGGERAPLGTRITEALKAYQTDQAFVCVVLSACIGFALFAGVSLVSQLLLRRFLRG